MTIVHAIWTLYRFECLRTATIGRQLMWCGLASFPIAICVLIRVMEGRDGGNRQMPDEAWGMIQFGMLPAMFCILGLLISVTPLLQSELEGKTWTYLSVRPGSRFAVVLGKYCAGVTWTIPFGIISALICALVGGRDTAVNLWLLISSLIILSAFTYGAIYALCGVINPRRGTHVAVVYTLVSEMVVSNLPIASAVARRFTPVFHLQQIMFKVTDWFPPLHANGISIFQHVFCLSVVVLVCLSLSIYILRQRELIANPEE